MIKALRKRGLTERVNGGVVDSDIPFEKSHPIFKIILNPCSDIQRLQSWNIGQSGKCVSLSIFYV